MRDLFRLRAAVLAWVAASACYHGAERDKEPPPGYPGGFCLAPDATCREGTCDVDGGAYCYDPSDPCRGVFCGGHGTCVVTGDQKPKCACDMTSCNEMFSLYCDPAEGPCGAGGGGDDEGAAGLPDAGG